MFDKIGVDQQVGPLVYGVTVMTFLVYILFLGSYAHLN